MHDTARRIVLRMNAPAHTRAPLYDRDRLAFAAIRTELYGVVERIDNESRVTRSDVGGPTIASSKGVVLDPDSLATGPALQALKDLRRILAGVWGANVAADIGLAVCARRHDLLLVAFARNHEAAKRLLSQRGLGDAYEA